MKRLISFILIFVLISSTVVIPCMAATTVTSTDISAFIPEGFSVYTKKNLPKTPTQLDELGTTYDEIKADFNSLGYVFLAHSSALKCTITLSEQKTKVSNTIKNLYSLKDQNEIEKAGKLLLGEVYTTAHRIKQVEKDYALFFRVEMYEKTTSTIMYVSVIDSVTYTLCLNTLDGVPSENVLSVFEGIFGGLSYSVSEFVARENAANNTGKKIVYLAIIAVCLAVATLLVISIVNDIGKMKLNDKRSSNVKKYKKPLR